ncbi:Long-chain-fatty-acid--CoA ligase [Microbulbifer aggregans]|uniref:Long-chain-fatty-acid--CoA ligase n=1 Tax=Microbulbifer aggregans TaxID=1769779 RepID=A0A1C9W9H4_9GAMM|nr:AMP-binding protein [Microbulbifer aggregans]AOS97817.1 Long-chain-fatty-acid--CoA ligase [Microbulbifer aggregans]
MTVHSLRDIHCWTTPQVLAHWAEQAPGKTAVTFIDGPSFTYGEIYLRSRQIAAGLRKAQIEAGVKVATLLPNAPEFCELWWGCHQADTVLVGLNTELLGSFLAHALNLSEARVLVCSPDQLTKLPPIIQELESLKQIFVSGDIPEEAASKLNIPVLPFEVLRGDAQHAPESEATFQDLAGLMFTSGTTGPSKAVMMPHAHCYLYGLGTIDNLDFQRDDTYYITMPLFHCNALFMQLYACLINGATAVIRGKFSASRWLSDIRDYGATHTNLLGVMTEFVDQQPGAAGERDHQLRVIAAAPAAPTFIQRFEQRFAVRMIELYGMSEVNIPLFTPLDAPRPGSCGKPYSRYFEVRVAEPATDLEVSPGDVGEIQVRPRISAGFMSGYYRMPEKTLEAWKNLWFHTGDAGRMDEDGYFYFVDRLKDCIRRRGENISSYEVETALLDYPGIRECAVIAVPADIEGGEDEVMAVVVADDSLDPIGIIDHCKQNIPRYAIPRYIRFASADEIPRTSTNKIRKVELRRQGITNTTWDCQQKTRQQRLSPV